MVVLRNISRSPSCLPSLPRPAECLCPSLDAGPQSWCGALGCRCCLPSPYSHPTPETWLPAAAPSRCGCSSNGNQCWVTRHCIVLLRSPHRCNSTALQQAGLTCHQPRLPWLPVTCSGWPQATWQGCQPPAALSGSSLAVGILPKLLQGASFLLHPGVEVVAHYPLPLPRRMWSADDAAAVAHHNRGDWHCQYSCKL